jgi:hypothetical protein
MPWPVVGVFVCRKPDWVFPGEFSFAESEMFQRVDDFKELDATETLEAEFMIRTVNRLKAACHIGE